MKGNGGKAAEGHPKGGGYGKSTTPSKGGAVKQSNEMRSDVTKAVTNKNPYPNGMC